MIHPSIIPHIKTAIKFAKYENLKNVELWLESLLNNTKFTSPNALSSEIPTLFLALKLQSLSFIINIIQKLLDSEFPTMKQNSSGRITMFDMFNRTVQEVEDLVMKNDIYTFPRIEWTNKVLFENQEYKPALAGCVLYKGTVYEIHDIFTNKHYLVYNILYNDKQVARHLVSDYYRIKFCDSFLNYGREHKYFETDLLGLKEFKLKNGKMLTEFKY